MSHPGQDSQRLDPAHALERASARRPATKPKPKPLIKTAPTSADRRKRAEPDVPLATICRIVHMDEYLIVVNKNAGFPVVPSGPFQKRSVLLALAAAGHGPLFPVHLLDPEATGLLLLSRTELAAQALRWNWRSSLCTREFIAVLQGDIAGGRGRITRAIGALQVGDHIRHDVVPGDQGGRNAVTSWCLLARGKGMARVRVTLHAGRCRQIRAHFAAIGYPIVGDRNYARARTDVPLGALVDLPTKYKEIENLPRNQIALHCSRIELPHPATQEMTVWQAPIPRAILALMPGAWIVNGA